jgi:hypothetical protein
MVSITGSELQTFERAIRKKVLQDVIKLIVVARDDCPWEISTGSSFKKPTPRSVLQAVLFRVESLKGQDA